MKSVWNNSKRRSYVGLIFSFNKIVAEKKNRCCYPILHLQIGHNNVGLKLSKHLSYADSEVVQDAKILRLVKEYTHFTSEPLVSVYHGVDNVLYNLLLCSLLYYICSLGQETTKHFFGLESQATICYTDSMKMRKQLI